MPGGKNLPDREPAVVQLREAVEELQILNEILSAVSTERNVERINRLILTKCLRHFGVQQGVIHLLSSVDPADSQRTAISPRTEQRLMRQSGELPLRLEIHLFGRIAHDKKPLLSNDLAQDERFHDLHAGSEGIRSVLAVPLMVRDQVIGVLSLFNRGADHPFDARDQRLLSMIALPVAQVIESTRLFALEEELRAAQTVQQHLLPKGEPRAQGLDLAGFSEPAREIGGDFYDWMVLPEGRFGCIVGDVSGKGLSAALLMAEVQGAFRALAHATSSPGEVMNGLARFLGARLSTDRFITMLYVVVDPARDLLTYASAGHEYPYLVHHDGTMEQLDVNGLLMCSVSTEDYIESSVPFRPGDCLVLYTDGVIDALDAHTQRFGRERFCALLQSPIDTARGAAERVRKALRAHIAGSDPYDDITLGILRRTEQGS